MKYFLRLLLVFLLIILGGCQKKERDFPDFSAIGKINVVQDVKDSTTATLRLFTTKKYQNVKVNKIDSPETFNWTVSEPKTIILKNQKQKRQSYYYIIKISFDGPAHFSKVELSLDGEVKTYNIGRFECKEMTLETDQNNLVRVFFDYPFDLYQKVFVESVSLPIIIQNNSDEKIELLSIKCLAQNEEYRVNLLKSNLLHYPLLPNESATATTAAFEVYTDNLMALETLFELTYATSLTTYKKIVKCSLGHFTEVMESAIINVFLDLEYLNEGVSCSLEEDLSNHH